jgi:hypothetical protein
MFKQTAFKSQTIKHSLVHITRTVLFGLCFESITGAEEGSSWIR